MGIYDEVCGIQIKCTESPSFKDYSIGDKIDLPAGIYIGYEGWFSVKTKKVTATGKTIYNKWGRVLTLATILDAESPILNALKGKEE